MSESICPNKTELVLGDIENRSRVEGVNMPTVDETMELLARCAVCDCQSGPQNTRILGVTLPRPFPQKCGKTVLSQ